MIQEKILMFVNRYSTTPRKPIGRSTWRDLNNQVWIYFAKNKGNLNQVRMKFPA